VRAIVFDRFGGPEVLRLADDIPTPEPGPDEILIAVHAAGVNPVDWKIREGLRRDRFPHEPPIVPGWDAAGTVAAVGANVRQFSVGERVFAYCRKPVVKWGAYCEAIAVAAANAAHMPARLSFVEAAAVPLAALTAWQSLFDAGSLARGQSVLVHAGAGGVGGYAVQLARNAGASRIVATASAANRAYVLGLGANEVIDYRAGSFVETLGAGAVDVAFDTVGEAVQTASVEVVRPGGVMVSILALSDETKRAAAARGVRTEYVFVAPSGAQLQKIAALFDAGALVPPAIETLPLVEAAEAQRRSQAGHVRGKLVLRVREG
jgi:NADPH2:quinone reductase